MMLPSYFIREIQIKTMKYHYTLTRKTQYQIPSSEQVEC